ncbi:putative membrane protein [Clostridium argentinense CDC 2741]|uniref:Putative membrane protein n=1 Tax=Clostridium argentinense CDC 2741 TaxID=1418104 RepID=A0A0C1U4N9_9CLOT|nr:DUF6773 family protein [Clostridium argentinense]ARC86219.1 hypothetical protein RSJ17_17820 [Clostridium argentinense]KIE47744.1 putative membrane protein [Clostridium argentinense CDC 2741]NFF40266.1 hypothetical protein [Clostridium argentinense]NFP50075.1 hypothetical protein [Clostridium argentinense]NFP74620.1 hypothetical protein [Clostridium argentinense]
MKRKKIKDERVLQLNNKIQSEAYLIVLFLAVVSVFIKSYVMDMSFSQYAFELGIIILSIAYIAVRSMLVGYDFMNNSKSGKVSTVSTILISSLVITIINGIRNYSVYGDKYTGILDGLFISVLVVTFISAAIFNSVVFVILYFFNMKGQQRIEKKLNEGDKQD